MNDKVVCLYWLPGSDRRVNKASMAGSLLFMQTGRTYHIVLVLQSPSRGKLYEDYVTAVSW